MALYAFDGTWNEFRDNDDEEDPANTNVGEFRRAYEAGSGKKQFYRSGVGTRFGVFGRMFGGIAGWGGHHRIGEAYRALCKNWARNDRHIDVVGFSRGAALALSFANYVCRKGIRTPDERSVVEKSPRIRFVGVWDVVTSFGIPINLGIPFQRINLGYVVKVPPNIDHCYHAIALDELRQTFMVTRLPDAHEVWFRGVHSDVGGGKSGNHELFLIARRWMFYKAQAAGLPILQRDVDALSARIRIGAALGKMGLDPIKNSRRKFLPQDRFHYSIADADMARDARRETEADEKIAQRVRAA